MTTPEGRQSRRQGAGVAASGDTVTITMSHDEAYLFVSHLAEALAAWRTRSEENHESTLNRSARNVLRFKALRISRELPDEYGKLEIPE